MDIMDNERKTIIDMFTTLVEKGKLSSSDVRNGLMDTIEFIDSLVCDAPKAYAYLGDILCAMILVKVIDVDWLCEQCEKTKASLAENPDKIIKALVGAIEAAKGKDDVKEILGSSAKSLETLLGDKWGEVLVQLSIYVKVIRISSLFKRLYIMVDRTQISFVSVV
jgi:hypothetical protein